MRVMRTYHFLFMACLLLLMGGRAPVSGADRLTGEYAVKAALVYNFARFTEWPEGAFDEDQDTFRIVIFGDENAADGFGAIDGKLIAERKIEIIHAKRPDEAVGCQLIFLAKTERDWWSHIATTVAGSPILTIGEMNGFLEAGGMMNLHKEHSKIRFQVNSKQAKKQNLAISSRILKLASSVVETTGGYD